MPSSRNRMKIFLVRSPSSSRQARARWRLFLPIKTRSGFISSTRPQIPNFSACPGTDRHGGEAAGVFALRATPVPQQVAGHPEDEGLDLVRHFKTVRADQPDESLLGEIFGFLRIAGAAQEIGEQGGAKTRIQFVLNRAAMWYRTAELHEISPPATVRQFGKEESGNLCVFAKEASPLRGGPSTAAAEAKGSG